MKQHQQSQNILPLDHIFKHWLKPAPLDKWLQLVKKDFFRVKIQLKAAHFSLQNEIGVAGPARI